MKWFPKKPAIEYTDAELRETPLYGLIADADSTSPGKKLPLNLPDRENLRLCRELIDEQRRMAGHNDPELPPPDDIQLAKII